MKDLRDLKDLTIHEVKLMPFHQPSDLEQTVVFKTLLVCTAGRQIPVSSDTPRDSKKRIWSNAEGGWIQRLYRRFPAQNSPHRMYELNGFRESTSP